MQSDARILLVNRQAGLSGDGQTTVCTRLAMNRRKQLSDRTSNAMSIKGAILHPSADRRSVTRRALESHVKLQTSRVAAWRTDIETSRRDYSAPSRFLDSLEIFETILPRTRSSAYVSRWRADFGLVWFRECLASSVLFLVERHALYAKGGTNGQRPDVAGSIMVREFEIRGIDTLPVDE